MSIESNWWSSLRHGGLLLSTARVLELFPDAAPALAPHIVDRLRGDILRLTESPDDGPAEKALIDTVLHDVAGLRDSDTANWQRGNDVQPRFTRRAASGEMVKPRRVWCGPNGGQLPVFVDDEPRLGIGRGRRSVSRVIEWCRGTGYPLALLTNGRQFRLLHVAAEHDAWCEWDTALWFEAGQLSAQVEAWQHLLAPVLHTPAKPDAASPLLDAIRRSRQGQSQLSSILGERVRQAVEVLIHAHTPYLTRQTNLEKSEIYRAGTLVVMRLVVALFAEARDLFPRSNRIYETSYGLQGLWEKLARAAGGNHSRLRQRYGAWPQVLALFRLIHDGSPHGDLSLRAYGGELFKPAVANDPEGVRRAMHLFESACYAGDPSVMSDAEVYSMLELLTRCAVPVRQGRTVTTVTVPVDFADLSTEYIGILYEGLLDYELHQVPATSDDPILFINLGDQPALPLSRLEGLAGNDLKTFFKEFTKEGGSTTAGEDEAEEDEDSDGVEEVDTRTDEAGVALTTESGDLLVSEAAADTVASARQRALAWARRAVVEAQLVKAYTGADPGRRADAEEKITRAANQLVLRTILPGDYFLVRWGGTRKGQGTFYTRPGLVAPTVQRTLAPLCYELPAEPSLEELRDPSSPRSPAVILALKVCDPATGSASFPVSALRYLAEALWRGLLHHQWLVANETAGTFRPGPGLPAGEPPWFRECVRDLPGDLTAAEGTIRARLKRLIVERCLYGVDLDPLAIELARLSLWIETMDRDLPFGFLDHKFKCGNGLVGCWFDNFQDYPALCLHRPGDDGGDKTHTTAVHLPKGQLSAALKTFREENLKPALVHWIEAHDSSVFTFLSNGTNAADLHAELGRCLESLHAMPLLTESDNAARAVFYHQQVQPALLPLRNAFDTWCALWFWPAEELQHFPLPLSESGHSAFTAPSSDAIAIIARVREQYRFFHWEIEFPDVFTGRDSGFHALLGNPPWEVQKPNSKEWFSNRDPLYRTYGKQEALRRQRDLFTSNPVVEREWIAYCARFKALSNWCANIAQPWGDTEHDGCGWSLMRGRAGDDLRVSWRLRRASRNGFSDPAHPFRHQGSADINSYKLFLEQCYALMGAGGRLGIILPSNVCTDKGSTNLRKLLLSGTRWEWLFGFINWNKIFPPVYYRFKFSVLIVQKGSQTAAIRAAFLRYNLDEWENAERFSLPYLRERVEQFSPASQSILELRDARDVVILEKIYAHAVLLGDRSRDGWRMRYATEFHMTSDSGLFAPRPIWEDRGYSPNQYGFWVGPDGALAFPLYEGRMIGQFDFCKKGWVSGKGRSADWQPPGDSVMSFDAKALSPQYLMAQDTLLSSSKGFVGPKVAFMSISSTTNARTTVATYLNSMPANHSLGFFRSEAGSLVDSLLVVGVMGTFTFDYQVRCRLGGLNMSEFVMAETAFPTREMVEPMKETMVRIVSGLALPDALFAREWLSLGLNNRPWRRLWSSTEHERLRVRCILDALVAHLFGLSVADLTWILRHCDYPSESFSDYEFYRTLDPKGFWRVEKETSPELRHTVLAQIAFQDLQRDGLDAFLTQNNGEGWMLPDKLRLADYGLGHDDRAREPQLIASRLGPRFFPWQLEGTAEQSWEECARHAALIRAIRAHGEPAAVVAEPQASYGGAPTTDLLGQPVETDLFGHEVTGKKRRKKT